MLIKMCVRVLGCVCELMGSCSRVASAHACPEGSIGSRAKPEGKMAEMDAKGMVLGEGSLRPSVGTPVGWRKVQIRG